MLISEIKYSKCVASLKETYENNPISNIIHAITSIESIVVNL